MLNFNGDQIIQTQDLVQMYENLSLKNEFVRSLRNYAIMVFQAGDLNKIKELFRRYSFIHPSNNSQESVQMLLGMFDEDTCRKHNLNPDEFHSYLAQRKQRSKVILESETKFCGVEREVLFKSCILPVLQTISENNSISMVGLIQQLVSNISSLEEDDAKEDVQMAVEHKSGPQPANKTIEL